MNQSEEFWKDKPEEAKAGLARLRAPFPPNVVGKLPRGRVQLDYVGHAAVTDRLLSVDPYWCWEPVASTPDGLPLIVAPGTLWIRLTVCGVTRLGVGDGSKVEKELVGDAIRNAAMRFGVALELWTKDELESAATMRQAPVSPSWQQREQEPVEAEPWVTDATLALLHEWASAAGWDADRLAAGASWSSNNRTSGPGELTETEAQRLVHIAQIQAETKGESS